MQRGHIAALAELNPEQRGHYTRVYALVPLALLAAAAGLVALCLSGRWNLRDPGSPPPEAAGEGVAPVPAARA